MALSDNIRKYRNAAGVSQMQLAKAVGVDQSAICKMEKGLFIPTIVLVAEIANVFDVSIDDLVYGKGV